MELEPVDDRQTDAKMWIEVDLAGIMRAVPGLLKGSIQRVSDREMAAIKVGRGRYARRRGVLEGGVVLPRAAEIEEYTVSQTDRRRDA
jgi:hypothetical protein